MTDNRKVTKLEEQRLYSFTREHFVEYFDVQIELVDHLATAIEDKWQEDTKVSFEDALNRVFKTFGIFGFSDIVEERGKALSKRYLKKIFKITVSNLKLPKILSSLAIASLLFVVTKFFSNSVIPSLVAFASTVLVATIFTFKQHRKWKSKDIKIMAAAFTNNYLYAFLNILIQIVIQGFPRVFLNDGYTAFTVSDPIIFIVMFATALFWFVMYESSISLEDDIENSFDKYLKLAH